MSELPDALRTRFSDYRKSETRQSPKQFSMLCTILWSQVSNGTILHLGNRTSSGLYLVRNVIAKVNLGHIVWVRPQNDCREALNDFYPPSRRPLTNRFGDLGRDSGTLAGRIARLRRQSVTESFSEPLSTFRWIYLVGLGGKSTALFALLSIAI